MKEFLLAIQARLIDQVPALKYIDENWGQLEYYGPNPPVKWPCSLIDVQQILWDNTGKKQQNGTGTLIIDVANIRLTNTSGRAPASQRNQAFEIHDIIQAVHQALHCWYPLATGSRLYRKSETRVKRDDGIQQYQVAFECIVNGKYIVEADVAAGINLALELERN
jgi:hypothetical protein